MDGAVFDAHCHAPSTRYLPRALIETSAENLLVALAATGAPVRRAAILDSFLAGLEDHLCDGFVAEMDAAGVAEALLLLPDFTFVLPGATPDIATMIAEHAAILARHPGRLHYFCGVDPRWGRDGVEIFERALGEHGCAGLKLYPPCGYSPSDPALHPFYELCRAWRVPVLLHTGPTAPLLGFGFGDPWLVDDAARLFPDVDFILAHGGVNNVEAACLLAAYRPNVYIDFSGYPATVSPAGPAGALRELFQRRLNHKIIFGTDWPIFRLRGSYRELVATVTDERGAIGEVPQREAALLLSGNIRRLLARRAGPGTGHAR